jgi:hypothetical protein
MSGFFTKVKNAGKFIQGSSMKAKLKAEIALIEQNQKGRKQQLGVEMYDLMEQKKTFGGKSETEPKVVEVFEKAEKDIAIIVEKKDAKQADIDTVTKSRDGELPAESFQEKAKAAGNQAKNAGIRTKIQAEMALLDREIKSRKQLFGIELFDALLPMEGFTPSDTEIKAIFDAAKQDIGEQQAKKDVKQEEINVLEAEQGATSASPAESNATV